MITKADIDDILEDYKEPCIATICSHTALQIFYGARQEGFKTIGIGRPGLKKMYDRFPLAKPDIFIEIEDYKRLLDLEVQENLRAHNAVIVPHGSFVEYIGARNILESFKVPVFGNREVLLWESDRTKERQWLTHAGIRMPAVFKDPSEIDRQVMVKFPGAKGGQDYFIASSTEEFERKLKDSKKEDEEYMIQEYVIGTRMYPHYFRSETDDLTQLLSADIRYESNIDGLVRVPQAIGQVEPTFVVTGNMPVVLRESLIPRVLDMGEDIVKSSKKLFSPGINGPFCIEAICTDKLEFVAFEISARIVAGTNLYMDGSPYSKLIYSEPMSTGRRIAREIKEGAMQNRLPDMIY